MNERLECNGCLENLSPNNTRAAGWVTLNAHRRVRQDEAPMLTGDARTWAGNQWEFHFCPDCFKTHLASILDMTVRPNE